MPGQDGNRCFQALHKRRYRVHWLSFVPFMRKVQSQLTRTKTKVRSTVTSTLGTSPQKRCTMFLICLYIVHCRRSIPSLSANRSFVALNLCEQIHNSVKYNLTQLRDGLISNTNQNVSTRRSTRPITLQPDCLFHAKFHNVF